MEHRGEILMKFALNLLLLPSSIFPKVELLVTMVSYEKKKLEELVEVCVEFLILLVDLLVREQEDQICTLRIINCPFN